ncbi:antibiotic biosynthesis monooxygenase family protein [Alkalihalobacillus pseudalcaliphilus]|uniref:antibiotic biosynthesis monooxygenase family protein n=1 Tax=Alkalihalobacillus pseudalcaliphilus TaxID=79884 RepID=UPI00064D73FE|nr:antibiotic biosynthesis monooxygenase [Alkalihalobacillus pseudalcaliphilus]KMK75622.1 JEMB protein [Alkalihalobacillus pseudalcaliphilus]
MNNLVNTFEIPYYAVIFASERTEGDNGYNEMASKMVALANEQKGFLGLESSRDSNLGITISYWKTLEDITAWKNHTAHQVAQKLGKEEWYSQFSLRICKVERDYLFKSK